MTNRNPFNPAAQNPPVPVLTQTVATIPITPIGIVEGTIYVAGDAMGDQFQFQAIGGKMPTSGAIHSGTLWDRDDEGLELRLIISREKFSSPIADHDAFVPTDNDSLKIIAVIAFGTTANPFVDFTDNQVAFAYSVGKAFSGELWGQLVTPGAPTIAGGKSPVVQIDILGDGPVSV